ncbi:MAG: transposase [Myxococcota bacterium]
MTDRKTYPTFADFYLDNRKRKGKKYLLDIANSKLDWYQLQKLLEKNNFWKKELEEHFYPPLFMFKIIVLQYWYDLSDQEIEDALYDRISFMRFVHLNVNDPVPDHTTIYRFRKRLYKAQLATPLFNEIKSQLARQELKIIRGCSSNPLLLKSHSSKSENLQLEFDF